MARRPGSNEFVFPIMVIVGIDVIVVTNVTIHITDVQVRSTIC